MAISAATVTEYALDETLSDQSQQSGNNQVVVADDFANSVNNNGNTTGTDYVGRLVVIELGETDEETRFVSGDATGTGDTRILTVSEDWTTNPASGDTIHVFYNMTDIQAANTRTGFYEMADPIIVGNGTDPSGLVMMQSELVEVEDPKSSTAYSLEAKSGGRLQIGYKYGGVPISGAYLLFIGNTQGETFAEFESGSELRLYDARLIGSLNPLNFLVADSATSDIQADNFTIINGTDEGLFYCGTWENGSISGSGTTTEIIRVSDSTTFFNITLINIDTFDSIADEVTETIELEKVTFVNVTDLINVRSNKTWNMIDPVWDATTYTDFTWISSTLAYIYDKRSVKTTVQQSDGTVIANANVLIYEGTQSDNLVLETYTNASGYAEGAFTYRLHSTNSSTTTYGAHAFRVDCWLYTPFIAAQTSTESFSGAVTLLVDDNISETTQATALTAGSGITWTEDTNPSSVIDFTASSGTLNVGDTVTASGGATGIVTEIIDGDSTDGTTHLKSRNATAFVNSDTLTSDGSGSWTGGAYTSDSEQEYSIWIDSNSVSLQGIYDYFAALTAETTLSATGELIHEWGRDSQGRVLYKSGSNFFTSRSNSKGIIVVNYGAGNITGFEDDAGTDWVPPSSVTLTINCKDAAGDAVGSASVRIETSSGTTISEGTANSTTGIFTDSYTYTGDVTVVIRVRYSSSTTRYIPYKTGGLIEDTGLTATVSLQEDTIAERLTEPLLMPDTLEMVDDLEMT